MSVPALTVAPAVPADSSRPHLVGRNGAAHHEDISCTKSKVNRIPEDAQKKNERPIRQDDAARQEATFNQFARLPD